MALCKPGFSLCKVSSLLFTNAHHQGVLITPTAKLDPNALATSASRWMFARTTRTATTESQTSVTLKTLRTPLASIVRAENANQVNSSSFCSRYLHSLIQDASLMPIALVDTLARITSATILLARFSSSRSRSEHKPAAPIAQRRELRCHFLARRTVSTRTECLVPRGPSIMLGRPTSTGARLGLMELLVALRTMPRNP